MHESILLEGDLFRGQETIWVLGSKGRIGRSITRKLTNGSRRIVTSDHAAVDIKNLEDVLIFTERNLPTVIINCAGMSSAKACEKDPDEAFRVNALGAKTWPLPPTTMEPVSSTFQLMMSLMVRMTPRSMSW